VKKVFFVNSFFEEELSCGKKSLIDFLYGHPVHLALHYMACFLAEEGVAALLAFPPEEGYFRRLETLGITPPECRFLRESSTESYEIFSWGVSPSLARFAKERGHVYKTPDFDVVKKVNGKDFSFAFGRKLPGAELLFAEKEIESWSLSTKGPKVLKTIYGSSGRGHCILMKEPSSQTAVRFFQAEKKRSPCLLAEPWVKRVLDFSSQWNIKENGDVEYLGATVCENSPRGIYRKSTIGPEELLFKGFNPFFEEHRDCAKKALEEMGKLGFFGNVGIDAMVYLHPETKKLSLQPVLEINARKTMGLAALQLYRKLKLTGLATFRYDLNRLGEGSFLPSQAFLTPGTPISLTGGLFIESTMRKPATLVAGGSIALIAPVLQGKFS